MDENEKKESHGSSNASGPANNAVVSRPIYSLTSTQSLDNFLDEPVKGSEQYDAMASHQPHTYDLNRTASVTSLKTASFQPASETESLGPLKNRGTSSPASAAAPERRKLSHTRKAPLKREVAARIQRADAGASGRASPLTPQIPRSGPLTPSVRRHSSTRDLGRLGRTKSSSGRLTRSRTSTLPSDKPVFAAGAAEKLDPLSIMKVELDKETIDDMKAILNLSIPPTPEERAEESIGNQEQRGRPLSEEEREKVLLRMIESGDGLGWVRRLIPTLKDPERVPMQSFKKLLSQYMKLQNDCYKVVAGVADQFATIAEAMGEKDASGWPKGQDVKSAVAAILKGLQERSGAAATGSAELISDGLVHTLEQQLHEAEEELGMKTDCIASMDADLHKMLDEKATYALTLADERQASRELQQKVLDSEAELRQSIETGEQIRKERDDARRELQEFRERIAKIAKIEEENEWLKKDQGRAGERVQGPAVGDKQATQDADDDVQVKRKATLGDLAAAREKLHRARADQLTATNDGGAVEAQNEKLRRTLEETERKLLLRAADLNNQATWEHKVKELRESMEQKKRELSGVREKLAALMQNKAANESEKARLAERVRMLETQIADLRQRSTAARHEARRAADVAGDEDSRAERVRGEIVESLRTRIRDLEREVAALKIDAQKGAAGHSALEAREAGLDEREAEMARRYEGLQDDLEVLQNLVGRLRADDQGLHDWLERLIAEVQAPEGKVPPEGEAEEGQQGLRRGGDPWKEAEEMRGRREEILGAMREALRKLRGDDKSATDEKAERLVDEYKGALATRDRGDKALNNVLRRRSAAVKQERRPTDTHQEEYRRTVLPTANDARFLDVMRRRAMLLDGLRADEQGKPIRYLDGEEAAAVASWCGFVRDKARLCRDYAARRWEGAAPGGWDPVEEAGALLRKWAPVFDASPGILPATGPAGLVLLRAQMAVELLGPEHARAGETVAALGAGAAQDALEAVPLWRARLRAFRAKVRTHQAPRPGVVGLGGGLAARKERGPPTSCRCAARTEWCEDHRAKEEEPWQQQRQRQGCPFVRGVCGCRHHNITVVCDAHEDSFRGKVDMRPISADHLAALLYRGAGVTTASGPATDTATGTAPGPASSPRDGEVKSEA